MPHNRTVQIRRAIAFVAIVGIAAGVAVITALVFDMWPFFVVAAAFTGLGCVVAFVTYAQLGPEDLDLFGHYAAEEIATPVAPRAPPPPAATRVIVYSTFPECGTDNERCECAICLNTHTGAWVVLPCGHIFHEPCISEWFRRKMQCPICKRTFEPMDFTGDTTHVAYTFGANSTTLNSAPAAAPVSSSRT